MSRVLLAVVLSVAFVSMLQRLLWTCFTVCACLCMFVAGLSLIFLCVGLVQRDWVSLCDHLPSWEPSQGPLRVNVPLSGGGEATALGMPGQRRSFCGMLLEFLSVACYSVQVVLVGDILVVIRVEFWSDLWNEISAG